MKSFNLKAILGTAFLSALFVPLCGGNNPEMVCEGFISYVECQDRDPRALLADARVHWVSDPEYRESLRILEEAYKKMNPLKIKDAINALPEKPQAKILKTRFARLGIRKQMTLACALGKAFSR